MSFKLALLSVSVIVAAGTAAGGSFVFTSGAVMGPDNNVSAEADFTVSTNTMTIVLKNLTSDIKFTTDELTGFKFTSAGLSTTLTSVSDPNGTIDCSTGTCVSGTPSDPEPYGWEVSGTGTNVLEAQGLHPYAIVNGANMDTSQCGGGDNGNICNAQHNPFLNGPVTFTLGFTGSAPTSFSGIEFMFGTGPFLADGNLSPAPEPRYYGLVLLGALGASLLARRRTATQI